MLIKCKDCQGSVSDKADLCPHCGCPVKSNEEMDPFWLLPKCPYCGHHGMGKLDAGARGMIFGGGGFIKAFSGTNECRGCGKVW